MAFFFFSLFLWYQVGMLLCAGLAEGPMCVFNDNSIQSNHEFLNERFFLRWG